jgi:hypothetical protein
MSGVILASVSLWGLGLFLVVFGVVGVAKYFLMRYGPYQRDASGRPTSPLTRGAVANDRVFAVPLMLAGCVGVILLIVSAVKYLVQA